MLSIGMWMTQNDAIYVSTYDATKSRVMSMNPMTCCMLSRRLFRARVTQEKRERLACLEENYKNLDILGAKVKQKRINVATKNSDTLGVLG